MTLKNKSSGWGEEQATKESGFLLSKTGLRAEESVSLSSMR